MGCLLGFTTYAKFVAVKKKNELDAFYFFTYEQAYEKVSQQGML